MALERNNSIINEDFGFSSQSYNDDLENIREIESEAAKSESGKIGIAGIMALAAGLGLIITGGFQNVLESDFVGVLQGGFTAIGIAAAGFGVVQTLRKVFGKSLDFPSISAHRKVFAQAASKAKTNPFQSANTNTNVGAQTFPQSNQGRKELRRSRSNRIFAGVAGGIGEYFGISPIFVRILLVGGFFFGGMSIFAYLLMALIIPKNLNDWRSKRR